MAATKMAASTEITDDGITLTEEYEVIEPQCTVRIPGLNGPEQIVTLRPGELVSSVLKRNNITRAQHDEAQLHHVD